MSEKEFKRIQCTSLIDFAAEVAKAGSEGWQVEKDAVDHAPRQQGSTFFTVLYKEEAAVKEQPVEKAKPVPPVRKSKQQNTEE